MATTRTTKIRIKINTPIKRQHRARIGVLDIQFDLPPRAIRLSLHFVASGERSSSFQGTVPFLSVLEATKRTQHPCLHRTQFLFQHQCDCCTQNSLQNLCVEASVNHTHTHTHTHKTDNLIITTEKHIYASLLDIREYTACHGRTKHTDTHTYTHTHTHIYIYIYIYIYICDSQSSV